MSAIAGMVSWRGVDDARDHVQFAMTRMAHRIPDGSGLVADGAVAFAHDVLHATPESVFEHQPCMMGDR